MNVKKAKYLVRFDGRTRCVNVYESVLNYTKQPNLLCVFSDNQLCGDRQI